MNRNELIQYIQKEYICDVNLKCDSDLIPNLIHESGIYLAYHMNKQHWISVDIEKYEDVKKLKLIVNMSYRLVRLR